MKKIRAIFKGQYDSCGFKTNEEYTLKLDHNKGCFPFIYRVPNSNSDDPILYETIEAFLTNWDNIRVIKEEPLFTTEDGVKIFKGNRYFYLSFGLNEVIAHNSASKNFLTDGTKRFSTNEAAKDWIAHQKPKSLKPEELVDGEIYATDFEIFRFKSTWDDQRICKNTANFYSRIMGNDYSSCYAAFSTHITTCHLATILEKQTLIQAEVKQDFYFELKSEKLKNKVVFHVGCVSCISQLKFGIKRCVECQYFKPDWNLPDLSIH